MTYATLPLATAGRFGYVQRPNPDTGEQEFAFQFRPGEPLTGWFSLNQILDGVDHAIGAVFEQVLAESWPDHEHARQEPS